MYDTRSATVTRILRVFDVVLAAGSKNISQRRGIEQEQRIYKHSFHYMLFTVGKHIIALKNCHQDNLKNPQT